MNTVPNITLGSTPRTALDPDIASLDLEPIAFLVAKEYPWNLQKIDDIELQYRCWLQCVRDLPALAIVPSRDIDAFWHCHVLALDIYLSQTQQLFGQTLLHNPFAGVLDEADTARHRARYQETRCFVSELVERVRSTRFKQPTAGV